MKVGMRKPSLKKSISARTTGKVKRKAKKAVNPLYGKKGMGFVKNPERAIKNKIYRKTTFSWKSLFNKGFLGIIAGCLIFPFAMLYYMIFWPCRLIYIGIKKLTIKTANTIEDTQLENDT